MSTPCKLSYSNCDDLLWKTIAHPCIELVLSIFSFKLKFRYATLEQAHHMNSFPSPARSSPWHFSVRRTMTPILVAIYCSMLSSFKKSAHSHHVSQAVEIADNSELLLSSPQWVFICLGLFLCHQWILFPKGLAATSPLPCSSFPSFMNIFNSLWL